jgi:hypothetical protein
MSKYAEQTRAHEVLNKVCLVVFQLVPRIVLTASDIHKHYTRRHSPSSRSRMYAAS